MNVSKSRLYLVLTFSVILIVFVFAFAYFSNQKTNSGNNEVVIEEAIQEKPNLDDWSTFDSQLGFSFQYPTFWGEPYEEIVMATETNQGSSGKLYLLTFSNNTKVYGSGRSSDFSAPRGGTRGDFAGYAGKGVEVKSYLDIVAPECFGMSMQDTFEGTIDFNLAGKEISGVRLQVPLLTDGDYWRIIELFEIPTLFEGDAKVIDHKYCFENGTSEELKDYELKGDAIEKYILEKQGLSEESLINLEIFEKISESATIY